MRTFLTTLLLMIGIGLMLPSALRAEDAKPAGDEPAADKPAGGKPAGDKPASDKPADGKPGAEKPVGDKPAGDKPGTPEKDEPPPEKGADPEKEGGPKKDGEEGPILHEDPEEEPPTEEMPTLPKKVYRHRSVTVAEAPPPAGMVYVPRGVAVIGTPYQMLAKLLTGRPRTIKAQFMFEGPEYRLPMPAFYIDKYEVTNQQYYVFLQATSVAEYHSDKGTYANLEEVAGALLGLPQEQWHTEKLYWRQLYEANRAKLHEVMPELVVKQGDQIDEDRTAQKFRHAPLKRGIPFVFYSRRPPEEWKGIQPAEDRLDHPVTSVSYNDAEAFAEWAGKHIPTEQEWEYAARGPEGFTYPWGDEWFTDAHHANWGGKITENYIAVTVPVNGELKPEKWKEEKSGPWLYDGMAWCGAWHMLGNVAEWTSSWFDRYPGNERSHGYMGQYAKVIRGASMEDVSPLVLRLAARNFIGLGPKGPPVPKNRFENVGFRCGWYGNPGQDKLGPMRRRAARGKQVKLADMALERWVGASARKWATPGTTPEGHVFVEGKAHSIVLVPRMSLLKPDQKKPKIGSRKDLFKASVGVDPFPLAVFHTDIPLDKVYVRDIEAIRKARAEAKDKKKGGRRRRGKPEAPPTKKGVVPAGTYLLAIWHERICLTQPSLELVCFLSKDTVPKNRLAVKAKMQVADVPASSLEVTDVADMFEFSMAVPVGGAATKKGVGPVILLHDILVNTVKGHLEKAGTWKSGHYIDPALAQAKPDEPEAEPETTPEPAEEKPAPEEKPVPEKPVPEKPVPDKGADDAQAGKPVKEVAEKK